MSCEHGVYRKEYCQSCTLGCGGGLMPHDPPTHDLNEKPACPRCQKTNVAYDFETNAFVCFECDFTV